MDSISQAAKEITRERKKESATKRGKNERECKKIPRKDGLMSSTVSSFRFFASAVVISLLSLRLKFVLTGEKVSKSALLWYTFAVGYTRGLETKETERKGTKRRDSGRSRLPQRLLLYRERGE